MTEVPATVESEHVPPVKRPERIIVTNSPQHGWIAHCDEIDWRMSKAAELGLYAFILRVAPPHKPGVDWASVVTECGDAIMGPEWSAVRAAIERYPVNRISPPVERRAEIDFAKLQRQWIIHFGVGCPLTKAEIGTIIEATRIVEEPKPRHWNR